MVGAHGHVGLDLNYKIGNESQQACSKSYCCLGIALQIFLQNLSQVGSAIRRPTLKKNLAFLTTQTH